MLLPLQGRLAGGYAGLVRRIVSQRPSTGGRKAGSTATLGRDLLSLVDSSRLRVADRSVEGKGGQRMQTLVI